MKQKRFGIFGLLSLRLLQSKLFQRIGHRLPNCAQTEGDVL